MNLRGETGLSFFSLHAERVSVPGGGDGRRTVVEAGGELMRKKKGGRNGESTER